MGSGRRKAGGGKHWAVQPVMGLPWEQQPLRSPAFKAEVRECCRFLGEVDGVCVSGVRERF